MEKQPNSRMCFLCGIENPITGLERRVPAQDVEHLRAVVGELQAELSALSPNGRQVMVERSGHYIQVDQPQMVIEAIREVVKAARH